MTDNSIVSFTFDTSDFDAMTVDIKDPTRRATMYALRAVGRELATEARSRAPVYTGDDPRVDKGALKRSIANARSLTADGDAYELKVGPFGTAKKGTAVVRTGKSRKEGGTKGQVRGVPLYRGKMEARYGYMAGGLAAAAGRMHEVFDAAYAKAWEKWSV